MKIRELLDQVAPDHQFILQKTDDHSFGIDGTIVTLRCSCRWETQRLVSNREMDSDYSSILTGSWRNWETLNHLLDQEVVHA